MFTSTASASTPPAVAAIPDKLKETPNWVAWREELRDGKPTKPPIDPHTGNFADVSNPKTWGTLKEALEAATRWALSGVGFVLTPHAGIVGIDLDDCRDPDTGEITRMAWRIVERFSTYTEVSPSGRGLHIFARGKLPPDTRRKGDVEMYDSARYFTVTGNRLESASAALEERQAAIGALHAWISGDAALVEQAKAADLRFAALWVGDASQYDNDHSRADQALCNMLAARCGRDAAQMDRIFRWSGLMRPKWDERHSADGRTYGQMTIVKALDEPQRKPPGRETASARGPVRVRTLEEIMASDEKPPEKVVAGLVEEGGISLLIARQKAGKSMLGLQIGIAVANGVDFLSSATSSGPVLYVDYENRSHILKERGNDFGRGFDVSRVHIANYESIADRDLGLDDDNLGRLKAEVAKYSPKLLIIDPLRLATREDLKDDRAMVKALERVSTLFEVNPKMGILLIHHLKKGQNLDKRQAPKLLESPQDWIDSIFGSQALLAHVETIIGLDQLGDGEYALATVARASGPMALKLTKPGDSERFILESRAKRLDKVSTAIKDALSELETKFPDGFCWTEGQNLVGNSKLGRAVRKAQEIGMLRQEAATKRYCWVKVAEVSTDESKAA